MPLAPWPRTRFAPGGSPARVTLFAFSADPLPEPLPLSRRRHGIPDGGPPPELSIISTTAAEAPDWYHAFFSGALALAARHTFGRGYAAIESTRYCHRIEVAPDDPPDLGYLQSAWAIARCVCEHGVLALLDAAAGRWHAPGNVLAVPPDAPFDLRRECAVVVETEPVPGVGFVAHTRGLAKFGRPDFVLLDADPGDVAGVARLLEALALASAMGERFQPGELVREAGAPARLAPYVPGEDFPDLHLDNDALVVALD